MRFYLAARYSRREELCLYRAALEALGHTVTSRWLNGDHQISDKGLSDGDAYAVSERVRFALEDWDDLEAADAVISFTEPPRSNHSRGGRHVEFGGALAMRKICYVVGYRENVFHCLPWIAFFETWEALLDHFRRWTE